MKETVLKHEKINKYFVGDSLKISRLVFTFLKMPGNVEIISFSRKKEKFSMNTALMHLGHSTKIVLNAKV